MPITFLHTADWQLAKPYARVRDDSKRHRLQQERLDCLGRIGAAAREQGAAFVVVAGDLFDSPSPTKATVSAACAAIGQMGIPVLAIPGNHDFGGPGSLWQQEFFLREQQQLAPNLRVLLQPEPLVLDGAVIFPAPLMRRHLMADPTAWIRNAFDEASFPLDLPRIVLAHGSVQGFGAAQDDEDESPAAANLIDLARLPEGEIDYIALGDWHGTKQVGPKAWYSGTPEIDRFPKGEGNEPGHILKVTASRGGLPVVEKSATARFGWHQSAFRFSEDSSLETFAAQLEAKIGTQSQDSLLLLVLEGSLGIQASQRLETLLETLHSRLLRLKLSNRVAIAPTDEEIVALTRRADDPLVATVACRLVALAEGENGEVARLALRELHSACSGNA
ncbi:DNA repair exonuclease [bacterium]|nr:DNA repair exonuclease [bacterium]